MHTLINSDCCNYLVAFVSLGNEMRDYKWKFPNPCNPLLLKSFQFVTWRLKRRHAPSGEDDRSTKNGKMAPKSNMGLGLNGRRRQSQYSGIIWCCLSDCETFRELLSAIAGLSQRQLHPRQRHSIKSCSAEVLSFLRPRISSCDRRDAKKKKKI